VLLAAHLRHGHGAPGRSGHAAGQDSLGQEGTRPSAPSSQSDHVLGPAGTKVLSANRLGLDIRYVVTKVALSIASTTLTRYGTRPLQYQRSAQGRGVRRPKTTKWDGTEDDSNSRISPTEEIF